MLLHVLCLCSFSQLLFLVAAVDVSNTILDDGENSHASFTQTLWVADSIISWSVCHTWALVMLPEDNVFTKYKGWKLKTGNKSLFLGAALTASSFLVGSHYSHSHYWALLPLPESPPSSEGQNGGGNIVDCGLCTGGLGH